MKRKQYFQERKDIKRIKLGKCHYCNNSVYSFNNNVHKKYIKLLCNHYSHTVCISRFLITNNYCYYCTKNTSEEESLNKQFQNMNINVTFFYTR